MDNSISYEYIYIYQDIKQPRVFIPRRMLLTQAHQFLVSFLIMFHDFGIVLVLKAIY